MLNQNFVAPVGRPVKQIQAFLSEYKNPKAHVGHDEYSQCPASAFLRYTIEVKDAIELCINQLPKKRDGQLTKASQDALQLISVAMLPTIMGHLETFQKFVFAETYTYSEHIESFDCKAFFKIINMLESGNSVNFKINTLLSYRGSIQSVGLLLAENLPSWHNPSQVNMYFSAFKLDNHFYSHDHVSTLETLWQLRHSIVHTGGTLTKSDAQKINSLRDCAGIEIAFQNRFLIELCKKFHRLIKDVTSRHEIALMSKLNSNTDDSLNKSLKDFFKVESSYPTLF